MTGLALGCSHTAGVGVAPAECYVYLLSTHYNTTITNSAVPAGNAEHCVAALAHTLRHSVPDFVIAQWPNPFRRTTWINGRAVKENINTGSTVFGALLAAGKDNFMQPWIQAIITGDTLCKLAGVPVVHILLEDLASEYIELLNNNNIVLHTDLKLPAQTWLFDSQGSDNQHHSARCHAQWAKRLIGLLNELTPR